MSRFAAILWGVLGGFLLILPAHSAEIVKKERIDRGAISQYRFLDKKGNSISDAIGGNPLKIGDLSKMTWISEGGLEVLGGGKIESVKDLSAWITAIQSSKALTFEAWISPSSACSNDEGVVFSSEKLDGNLNFELRQKGETYYWSLRNKTANSKGTAIFSFKLPASQSSKKWEEHNKDGEENLVHVALTINSKGIATLYLNGVATCSASFAIDFSSWDKSLKFQLTPQFSKKEGGWKGSFFHFTCFARDLSASEVKANYDAGLDQEIELIPTVSQVNLPPILNGGARIEGSIQQMTAGNTVLNGDVEMEDGDFLILGSPHVKLNGKPTLKGIIEGEGKATPNGHEFTMNGGAELRYLVTRVDPVALPLVQLPISSKGTRTVVLNNSKDKIGDWKTLKNLTLNGCEGAITVPSGAYGAFAINGGNTLVLGESGSKNRIRYDFESLSLNGSSNIELLSPVQIYIKRVFPIIGTMGDCKKPENLWVNLYGGDFILNGSAQFYGRLNASASHLIVNGNSLFEGMSFSNQLTVNGCGVLRYKETGGTIINLAPTGTLADVTVPQDSSPSVIDLFAAFQDDHDPDASLKFEVTQNSNPTLVTPTISAGKLTLTYGAGKNGASVLKVKVTDTGGLFIEPEFKVTVTSVNHNPTVSVGNLTVTEDTPANFTVTASDVDGDTLTTTFTGVTKGTVTGTYPNYIYTPNLNVNG
ncbi:MAG: Ig-like domain-containing protein, partial [Verrucomicrobiota bacterium]